MKDTKLLGRLDELLKGLTGGDFSCLRCPSEMETKKIMWSNLKNKVKNMKIKRLYNSGNIMKINRDLLLTYQWFNS